MMRVARFALALTVVAGLAGLASGEASSAPRTRLAGNLFLETTTSNHLIAVDTETGRSRPLPISLNCGDALFCVVPTGGDIVIGSVGRTYVYDPSAPGPPRSHRIGKGWIIFPSASDRRVWLGLLDHSTHQRLRRRELRDVREETVTGRVTRNVGRPPGGRWPAGAVDAGLLFQGRHGLRLWKPARRAVTGRFPGAFPVDTHGNLVAHCGEPCPRYFITDAGTGETTRVKPPAGYSFRAGYDGAFSADGSLLAVPLVADGSRSGSHWSVALIETSAGVAGAIPGARLPSIYQAFTWSTSGALFFTGHSGTVLTYRPGESRATVVPGFRVKSGGAIIHMAAP
jgi:hypothetical protein